MNKGACPEQRSEHGNSPERQNINDTSGVPTFRVFRVKKHEGAR
jgi:hypothetical protein